MSKGQKQDFCISYIGPRDDIARLIPNDVRRILDVGCSIGELGRRSKERINTLEVVGIELNKQMAVVAREKLDRVIVGDIERISLEEHLSFDYFDCIIFADILEHLKDPWSVLRKSAEFLADGGTILASIPNVRHYTTILNLAIKGYWPYPERGIHDRTHLRFFTVKNIKEMFQNAGLKIVRLERNYRIIERPHRCNRFSKYLARLFLKDFLTFQYLIVAEKAHENLNPNR